MEKTSASVLQTSIKFTTYGGTSNCKQSSDTTNTFLSCYRQLYCLISFVNGFGGFYFYHLLSYKNDLLLNLSKRLRTSTHVIYCLCVQYLCSIIIMGFFLFAFVNVETSCAQLWPLKMFSYCNLECHGKLQQMVSRLCTVLEKNNEG